MYNFGDIILAEVQFTDTFEVKVRPALVLFEDCDNLVVAGITSNTQMKGIPLTKKDGAFKDSVVKINYIFTISDKMVKKFLFRISKEKKEIIKQEIIKRIK